MTKLSQRVRSLSDTGTVAFSARAAALAAAGRNIINLAVGAPDYGTPDAVAEAAIAAIRRGETRYSPTRGNPELRKAICVKFSRDNHLAYADEQVTIGAGAKHVILNLLLATLDPGDEAIVPAPYYSSYPDLVRLCGGEPVIVECPSARGFKLSPEALENAITGRTRWLVLNSPGNPCGAVYSRSELAALAQVLRRHPAVHVLADEIYENCLFTDEPYASFASLDDEMFARTATVNGVSKTYGMTGWRIGFAGGPAELMTAATKIQGQSTTCPSSIGQVAAAHALAGPQDVVAEHRRTLRVRRDAAVERLNRLEGIACTPPDGGIYLYADCAGLIGRRRPGGTVLESDSDVALFLLEEAEVAVVPGIAFGWSPFLRITFAVETKTFEQASGRIEAALDGLG